MAKGEGRSGEYGSDALLAAGVAPEPIYQDVAFDRHDDSPGLAACLKAL